MQLLLRYNKSTCRDYHEKKFDECDFNCKLIYRIMEKQKKRCYNHKKSFNHMQYADETRLSNLVWHLKEKVRSEVHHTILKHLKKVSFAFV